MGFRARAEGTVFWWHVAHMECRQGLRRRSRELHFLVFGHLCGPPSHWQHSQSIGSIFSGWERSRLVRGSGYVAWWASSAFVVSSGWRRSRVASCRDFPAGSNGGGERAKGSILSVADIMSRAWRLPVLEILISATRCLRSSDSCLDDGSWELTS